MTQRADQSTGEIIVVDEPETADQKTVLALYSEAFEKESHLPIHLAMLKTRNDLTNTQRFAMLNTYTAIEPVSMRKYVNQVVLVVGAIVHWHGPYQSKSLGTDGLPKSKPGYYHMLLKLDKFSEREVQVGKTVRTIRENVIVATSAQQPCDFFLAMLTIERWYDWEYGIPVIFSGDEQGLFVRTLDSEEFKDAMRESAEIERRSRSRKGQPDIDARVEEVTA